MRVFLLAFILTACVQSFSQNIPPVAVPDTIEVISQVPTMINVLANDYDPDGDAISVNYISYVGRGTAIIKDGQIEYRSDPYVGDAYLKYNVIDNDQDPLQSQYVKVVIKILPNPDIPVAVPDTFNLMRLIPHQVDILQNDYDPLGSNLKISRITTYSSCHVSISNDSLSVIVTPFYGNPSFYYYASQTGTSTNYSSMPCKVRILPIENPDVPVLLPDSAITTGGLTVDIPVLDNDTDLQGDELEIFKAIVSSEGTIEVIDNSIIRYTPPLSFCGETQLYYKVREVIDTTIYTEYSPVKVTVWKNPNCPVAVNDVAYGMVYVPMTIDVLPNDYDINNNEFEIMGVSTGSIVDNKISYISSPIATSPVRIKYRIREVIDTLSYSEEAEVLIHLAQNPDLPVAVTDFASAHGGIAVLIDPLANDILNASDTLILAGGISLSHKGVVSDSLNLIRYIPAYQASGRDTIQYYATEEGSFIPILRGLIIVDITSQFTDILDINNIRAKVHANGYLFNDFLEIPGQGLFDDSMKPFYRFPASSLQSTIFSNCLWFGGLDNNDSLHFAGERFKQVGIDFQAGPVSNNYDDDYFLKYGRVWKLNKSDIDFHRQNFYKQGYQPIEAISSWPGNGEVTHGEAALLAPFGDLNNDGVYRWQDGDYPLIRGDQTIFFMYNDDMIHTETGGEKMKIEVHGMVYGYDRENDTAVYNSLFAHFDVINRSSNVYHDTYFSVFTDIDLGCANDDYLGCDVTRGSFYAYNGSDNDCVSEHGTYGNLIPAQSVTILAGPFIDNDGLDNASGVCDESINGLNFGNGVADDERYGMAGFSYFNNVGNNVEFYMTDPQIAIEYYNYMKGIWRDGTHYKYGGNGHPSTGAVNTECKFIFPGDSDPLNYGTSCMFPEGGYNQNGKFWTEEETGNVPGDRRGLGIMGPFTFKPGDVQEIELAFCTGLDIEGALASLDAMFSNIDSLFNKVDDGEIILPNDLLGFNHSAVQGDLIVYPNPSGSFITIKGLGGLKPVNFRIYNLLGFKVMEGIYSPTSDKLLNISGLAKGMYVICIDEKNGQQVLKFIKQ